MKVCRLLLDHGANALWQDSEGCSALYLCCQFDFVELCKLLYKYGARDKLLYKPNGAVLIKN